MRCLFCGKEAYLQIDTVWKYAFWVCLVHYEDIISLDLIDFQFGIDKGDASFVG